MNIAVFGANASDTESLRTRLPEHDLHFYSHPLDVAFAAEDERYNLSAIEGLCVFVHDRVSADAIGGLRSVRLIVTRSTGFDHIDMEAANAVGITVCNVPNYGERSVAEFTFALILALSRNLHRAYSQTLQGDISLDGLQGSDLNGKTIGIVGAGRIGLHVASIARGFEMRVLATDVAPRKAESQRGDITYTTLDDLLAQSDVVTLHAPLTSEDHHLIDAASLQKMKRGARLINTGRGGLADTEAVMAALDSGQLGGAALDVLEEKEQSEAIDRSLMASRPNLILTPHMAGDSREAAGRIIDTTVGNIRAFVMGVPQNVVSGPAIDDGPYELYEA